MFGIDVNDVKRFKSQRKATNESFSGSSIFSESFVNNYPTYDFDWPYFNNLSLGARVFTPIPAGIRNRRIGIIYSILTDNY